MSQGQSTGRDTVSARNGEIFFACSAHELTDRAVPLEKFWGSAACQLESRLAELRSAADCCHIVAAAIRPPDARPNDVQPAVEAITAAHDHLDLEWVTRQAGISDRQFRRSRGGLLRSNVSGPLSKSRNRRDRGTKAAAHTIGPGAAAADLVYDMPAAVRFYREVLGFELVNQSRDGDDFENQIRAGACCPGAGAEIMLNTMYEREHRPPQPDPKRSAAHRDTGLFFACRELDVGYEYLRVHGVASESSWKGSPKGLVFLYFY